jgi:hypothetical protein
MSDMLGAGAPLEPRLARPVRWPAAAAPPRRPARRLPPRARPRRRRRAPSAAHCARRRPRRPRPPPRAPPPAPPGGGPGAMMPRQRIGARVPVLPPRTQASAKISERAAPRLELRQRAAQHAVLLAVRVQLLRRLRARRRQRSAATQAVQVGANTRCAGKQRRDSACASARACASSAAWRCSRSEGWRLGGTPGRPWRACGCGGAQQRGCSASPRARSASIAAGCRPAAARECAGERERASAVGSAPERGAREEETPPQRLLRMPAAACFMRRPRGAANTERRGGRAVGLAPSLRCVPPADVAPSQSAVGRNCCQPAPSSSSAFCSPACLRLLNPLASARLARRLNGVREGSLPRARSRRCALRWRRQGRRLRCAQRCGARVHREMRERRERVAASACGV